MRVHLDCSVFSETSAVGRFSGELDFGVVPRVGEKVAFPIVVEGYTLADFMPHLDVKTVMHTPGTLDTVATIFLEDVVVSTNELARAILAAVEKVPGLWSDYWDGES